MKPLALTADLARAVLDGRKTETRRPVSPQPPDHATGPYYMLHPQPWNDLRRSELHIEAWSGPLYHARPERALCGAFVARSPLGSPGDLLWLREPAKCIGYTPGRRIVIEYAADGETAEVDHPARLRPVAPGKGLPNGIHREAARWWGRVVEVRVERLRAIDEGGAMREGIDADLRRESRRTAFADVWDAIYSRRGLGWADNPWVWVTRFERVARPDDWTPDPGGPRG